MGILFSFWFWWVIFFLSPPVNSYSATFSTLISIPSTSRQILLNSHPPSSAHLNLTIQPNQTRLYHVYLEEKDCLFTATVRHSRKDTSSTPWLLNPSVSLSFIPPSETQQPPKASSHPLSQTQQIHTPCNLHQPAVLFIQVSLRSNDKASSSASSASISSVPSSSDASEVELTATLSSNSPQKDCRREPDRLPMIISVIFFSLWVVGLFFCLPFWIFGCCGWEAEEVQGRIERVEEGDGRDVRREMGEEERLLHR